MSQSGGLWSPRSDLNSFQKIVIDLPGVKCCWKLVLASVAALLEFSKKIYEKMSILTKIFLEQKSIIGLAKIFLLQKKMDSRILERKKSKSETKKIEDKIQKKSL